MLIYCSELAVTLFPAFFSVCVYKHLMQFLFHASRKLDLCASVVRWKLFKRFDTPLTQCCLTPVANCQWRVRCSIVQSIIRQQRSQQAYSSLTLSHRDLFILLLFPVICSAHIPAGEQLWRGWGLQTQGHCVCYDWPRGDRVGTTSPDMSQMLQLHGHRQWKREGCLVRRFAVRLCRVGSGDK